MRMLKVRKKSICLIVALTFLLTLFPLALPAFAADYTRLGAVKVVDDDGVFNLNTVKATFAAGELEAGDVVIIRLPEDFEFRKGADKNTAMTAADWAETGTVTTGVYGYGDFNDGGAYLATPTDTDEGFSEGDLAVEKLDDNEIKVTVVNTPSLIDDAHLFIYLNNIYVDEGFDGDIELTFDAPPGSGFDDGSVVVGRVSGGEVEVEVIDTDTFSDKGQVTLRLTEDRPGAFEVDDESVKIILPDGFVWDTAINGKPLVDDKNENEGWEIKTIYGSVTGAVYVDEDELIIDINGETSDATCIEITATIDVDDETEAELGDIVADVEGESDLTPSEIVVGTYGEYQVDVTVADAETVYAGQLEQEIADITIEEIIEGSLVDGRTITLTLPSWAKWGALPDEVSDGSVTLTLSSFPGKDGQVAKYTVKNPDANDAAELDLEDMEVVLSPEAPEGDLVVEIGGTAGIDEEVKVAEVVAPLDVTVSEVPNIVIGRSAQDIGEITITEADAGILEAGTGKNLVLELPEDVEWDDYEVEVVEGDLELGDIDADNEVLTIEIDDDSNEASTIKITGTVVAYRTVPEGEVTLDVKGEAVIEVNTEAEIDDYYGDDVSGYWQIEGIDAIEHDEDGLFEEDDTVASVVVAKVGTPAPGEQKVTATFTIGSTTYTVDGVEQTMDVAPYIKDGRTFLPMRYVGKALGVSDQNILWSNGSATFIKGDRVVQVTIGSKTMVVNGAQIAMDVAPEIVSGRTMLPIRWLGVAFGADLSWDNETKTVTVEQ